MTPSAAYIIEVHSNLQDEPVIGIGVEYYRSPSSVYESAIAFRSTDLEEVRERIRMWTPSCLGGCDLSEEFLAKYPEARWP